MLKFLRFFLAFLSILLLIFLINISFFSANKTQEDKLSFLSEVDKIGKTQELLLSSQSKLAYNTQINFFDNIYHTNKDSFEVENNLEKVKIKLNP
jgi:hypothetical protein